MIWIFEHGSYSDRHLAPALNGPDDADIKALHDEFVRAARSAGAEDFLWIDALDAAAQAKMKLDLKRAYSEGFESYLESDLFAAWVLQNKPGWSRVAERRVCIDDDKMRRAWCD